MAIWTFLQSKDLTQKLEIGLLGLTNVSTRRSLSLSLSYILTYTNTHATKQAWWWAQQGRLRLIKVIRCFCLSTVLVSWLGSNPHSACLQPSCQEARNERLALTTFSSIWSPVATLDANKGISAPNQQGGGRQIGRLACLQQKIREKDLN